MIIRIRANASHSMRDSRSFTCSCSTECQRVRFPSCWRWSTRQCDPSFRCTRLRGASTSTWIDMRREFSLKVMARLAGAATCLTVEIGDKSCWRDHAIFKSMSRSSPTATLRLRERQIIWSWWSSLSPMPEHTQTSWLGELSQMWKMKLSCASMSTESAGWTMQLSGIQTTSSRARWSHSISTTSRRSRDCPSSFLSCRTLKESEKAKICYSKSEVSGK